MRFSTDDGNFGLIVTPLHGRDMFKFQLIVDGQVVGDEEPCILGSAMRGLKKLKSPEDARLDRLAGDPVAIATLLRADEALHGATTLSLAESLDRWMVKGYVINGTVVMMAQSDQMEEMGPLLVSTISIEQFETIVDTASRYWSIAKDEVG